jgi:putative FmdB family regulatory protein
MPLYEYECQKCHHRFERIQTFAARHTRKCPECGGPIEQMISAPAVQFKGSGFYVTDYPKKSSGGSAASSSDSGPKAESKSESKTESKSESKKDGSPKSESSSKKAEKK